MTDLPFSDYEAWRIENAESRDEVRRDRNISPDTKQKMELFWAIADQLNAYQLRKDQLWLLRCEDSVHRQRLIRSLPPFEEPLEAPAPMMAFELTPLMLRLLKQAWSDGHIYPSDYMDRRLEEMTALREMAKHGFVHASEEDPRLPGPPAPPRWFITDKGLEAASSALTADIVHDLQGQAFKLSPHDQYRLAFFIAENVGYVLAKETDFDAEPQRSSAGSEGEPFMMLSCREAKQCLHNIPGCICDGDPTNG